MRLVLFPPSRVDTAVQQLPEPDLVVDPRPIGWMDACYKFKVTVNGTTLTITRTDPPENRRWNEKTGWLQDITFRVYNSNEDRYSFDSSKYLFHGLEDERAPRDTTEAIIKDGVETIGYNAFFICESLVKVTIPASVKRIEYGAFKVCDSLRFVQLPPNLEYIGRCAFHNCESLEALFLPPTVTQIGDSAFRGCTSLRILNIPDSVERIGDYVIHNCDCLRTDEMAKATTEERIEWLRNRYNPFHSLCCQPSPSPQAIAQHIQDNNNNEETARTNDKPQFTALHLLAANPSVTGEMIMKYLQLAPDVATMQDSIGMTPLHMLCSRTYFSSSTRDAIRAYLSFTEGKEAAFMTDSQGKTPFQYLCEKSFDDMPFLESKSFGGFFCWWYDCLEMNLFT